MAASHIRDWAVRMLPHIGQWAGRVFIILCVIFTIFSLLSLVVTALTEPIMYRTTPNSVRTPSTAIDVYLKRESLDSLKESIFAKHEDLVPQRPGSIAMFIPLDRDSIFIYLDLLKECGCPAKDFRMIRYFLQKGHEWMIVLDTTLSWQEYQNIKMPTI
jgi:hypothetical protein